MFNSFFQYLAESNHRGLIVFVGEKHDSTLWAKTFLEKNCRLLQVLWLGNVSPNIENIRFSMFRNVNSHLGTENHVVVFDAFSGFSPNAFCAAVDTVAGGGIIILLAPEFDTWLNCRDEGFSLSYKTDDAPRRFISRLVRYLKNSFQAEFSICADRNNINHFLELETTLVFPSLTPKLSLNSEQDLVVAGILNVINGRPNRPLVINAARGRGKSSALGFALAEWLKKSPTGKIVVTGPDFNAVARAFYWVEKQLGICTNEYQLRWQDAVIEYMPVDRITVQQPSVVALIIDEAAAIPISTLQSLLKRYSRMVFISTTIGYEGSGRGFVLKFTQMLDEYSKQWRRLSLSQSVRWAENDGFEQWLNQCFLLDDRQVLPDSRGNLLTCTETIRCLSRDELMEDEVLLQSLFRLLVNAHYRTEPDDLRYLLDIAEVKIFAGFLGDQLVSAALVVEEAPFSLEKIDSIRREIHRPKGHLLAQTLALQEGIYDALRLSMWRIVRIAVQPELQRCGLGKSLLKSISQVAQESGVDCLGSSFAADPAVFRFWVDAGFSPLRLGLHRDHVSASFSVIVTKAFTQPAKVVASLATQRLLNKITYHLSKTWFDVDPLFIVRLLKSLPYFDDPSDIDVQQFNDYLRSATAYESAWFSLLKMLIWALSQNLSKEDENTYLLSVRCVLQGWSWRALADTYNYTGRKEVEKKVKEDLAKIFAEKL